MRGYGQDDCGSLSGRNIFHIKCVCMWFLYSPTECMPGAEHHVTLFEALPTLLLILLVPGLSHWGDQHLYRVQCREIERVCPSTPVSISQRLWWKCVVKLVHMLDVLQNLILVKRTTFQNSTVYCHLLKPCCFGPLDEANDSAGSRRGSQSLLGPLH
jgi:hypothetical protein